jgi:hypothetical protein
MKDYILREIDKISKVIEAILLKVGILKRENKKEELIEVTKLELLEKLNIDFDKLLENENFIDILIQEYLFNNNNLEKFADLLFDFVESTGALDEKKKLIYCIGEIYTYLVEKEHPMSFNMFYILTELKKYS